MMFLISVKIKMLQTKCWRWNFFPLFVSLVLYVSYFVSHWNRISRRRVWLTGAIQGIVIISKDLQGFPPPTRHLGHVRHQVIWNAIWILSYLSGFMRSDWIEVTEDHNVPILNKEKNHNSIKFMYATYIIFLLKEGERNIYGYNRIQTSDPLTSTNWAIQPLVRGDAYIASSMLAPPVSRYHAYSATRDNAPVTFDTNPENNEGKGFHNKSGSLYIIISGQWKRSSEIYGYNGIHQWPESHSS